MILSFFLLNFYANLGALGDVISLKMKQSFLTLGEREEKEKEKMER